MLGDIERRLSLGKGAKQLLAGDQSQDFEQPVFAELIREIEEKEEEEQLREIGIDGIEGESVEVELEPTIKSEVDISVSCKRKKSRVMRPFLFPIIAHITATQKIMGSISPPPPRRFLCSLIRICVFI